MNLAFFGTSNRSIPILNALNQSFDLKLCVTKQGSEVGTWAKDNNVETLVIKSIKTAKDLIIDKIRNKEIELGVVADFGFIITRDIINTPKHGLINIHFSLLPKHRGATPVQAAILAGDEKTGISYYLLDENMDAGNIIYQSEYKIAKKKPAGEIYKEMFIQAGQEVSEVINRYVSKEYQPKEQDHENATYAYSKTHPKTTHIFKEDAQINWQDSPIQIQRQVYAYQPWPVAWTTLEELDSAQQLTESVRMRPDKNKALTVKIFDVDVIENELKINKLQVEGKNIVNWEDFKNGYAVAS